VHELFEQLGFVLQHGRHHPRQRLLVVDPVIGSDGVGSVHGMLPNWL
jgi:hypothetical protein